MPSDVPKATVTSRPLASPRITSNAADSPSAASASPIETSGGSSLSVIVPMPSASASAAPTGDDSFTTKVSVGSARSSSFRNTWIVRSTVPAWNVSVPDAAS